MRLMGFGPVEPDPAGEDVGRGWFRVTDDEGEVFFWNEDSEVSQWEPPSHLEER